MRTRVIPASRLSDDPDTADWLFESAAISEGSDPLEILLQRELEEEDDRDYYRPVKTQQ